MIPVVVKNCKIGEGKTKIIVPIVAPTREAILAEAKTFHTIPVDVVEWRIDLYEDVRSAEKVIETAGMLQEVLDDIPLLVTYRSAIEGGKTQEEIDNDLTPAAYGELLKAVCASGKADLVDVEIFIGDEVVKEVIEAAHANGVKVIASNHDWTATPSQSDIVYRLRKMQDAGADIPKIAVTPTCKKDVITLLAATEEMATNFAKCPLITMSMRGMGGISRLVGEALGSAMTFGAAAKASAPGQIDVNQLDTVLETIHNSL